MIEGNKDFGYSLGCDHCENEVEEDFEEFQDAVDYKKENGWKPVKDKDGKWHDLCPDCQAPDIIRKVRGY